MLRYSVLLTIRNKNLIACRNQVLKSNIFFVNSFNYYVKNNSNFINIRNHVINKTKTVLFKNESIPVDPKTILRIIYKGDLYI